MRKYVSLSLLLLMTVVTFFGCAGMGYVWKSDPETQTVSNEYFDAQLEPFCSAGGCTAFVLTIKNKSDKNLELNWNKTLFVNHGQTSGGFMFEGVVFKDRNNPKPPDVIFPNGHLVKSIYPNNLVGFYSGKYARWYHSPMDSGMNGAYLSVIVDGKEINEKLTVNLSRTEQK